MKSLWRYAVVIVAVMAACLLLPACGDEEEDEGATATPAATEEASPTSTPEGAADPEDFGEFADLVAQAAAEQDTAFFAERAKGRTYTCSEADFAEEGLGPIVVGGRCQEVGQEIEVVEFWYWHSEGILARPGAVAESVEDYFSNALPAEDDKYGTGAVRLYATGVARSMEPDRTFEAAVLTAITPRGEGAAREPARTARGIHFDYVEGQWVIMGMLFADVLAEELLSEETAPYDEWEKY